MLQKKPKLTESNSPKAIKQESGRAVLNPGHSDPDTHTPSTLEISWSRNETKLTHWAIFKMTTKVP